MESGLARLLYSLALPDRYFPFVFVVAEPQRQTEKVVWQCETSGYTVSYQVPAPEKGSAIYTSRIRLFVNI